jgi:quercetin dioxygenase-like cupin family protein
MSEDRRALHVPPGEGNSYWVAGDFITLKVTGKDTQGAFAVAETTTAPQVGPPPHVHSREDETFYVLEGTFEFLAGDRTLTATVGAMVHGPRGIPHTFKNVGSTTGKLLVITTPAGFGEFVAEVGVPASDTSSPPPPPGPAEIEHLVAVARKYGIELLGPPPSH